MTLADRVVAVVESAPDGITASELVASVPGLKLPRARNLLSRLAMYGKIKRLKPYNPNGRQQAVYAAIDKAIQDGINRHNPANARLRNAR